jgi:hypothetical protein
MDAKIVFKPGLRGDNLVKVGDMDLTMLTQTGELSISAGGGAVLTLGLCVSGCEVSVEQCEVRINATPVDDIIGRAVYESLKSRYEP